MSGNGDSLGEGWYLMSVADLEIELARRRGRVASRSNTRRLGIEEALAYRNAGNIPDELGRTLRLVLYVDDDRDAARLHEKRLLWEPDFHEAPRWRIAGSAPVNVVPLRRSNEGTASADAWWDDPDLRALEEQWIRTGAVAGLRIPGEYRGFVYKTVLALRDAGAEITVQSLIDSIARWLDPNDVATLKAALDAAND